MKTNLLTYGAIREAYLRKEYKFFYNGEFNLNIFGIRAKNGQPNKFDDIIGLAYLDEFGKDVVKLYKATTDPGRYYLLNPININGTAILAEGQYRGAFKLGLHKSEYAALVQVKELKVYRDRNRDANLDLDKDHIEEGIFGINIHRASMFETKEEVGKWSAGCQVIQSTTDFKEFIEICKKQNSRYGNSFTYTLFNEGDFS